MSANGVTRVICSSLCLLVLPLAGGCLVRYCLYPTLDRTPATQLPPDSSEVCAFRVDISTESIDGKGSRQEVTETLTEVPVSSQEEVPALVKPSVSFGILILPPAMPGVYHFSHSVALRLYRPGYELVEIKSWDRAAPVQWKQAADLEAQEKALAALFPVERLGGGKEEPAHRRTLLFGASEYERLAATAQSSAQRARLLATAKSLRDLADSEGPIPHENDGQPPPLP
jgi:hypothetical protein